MITEGIGKVAPVPYAMVLTTSELRIAFLESQRRANHRGYSVRSDAWGKGIKSGFELPGIGSLTQDIRPIFVGLLGEFAVRRFVTNRFPGTATVDTTLNAAGDFGVDLKAFDLTMQVKTRQASTLVNLIRVTKYVNKSFVCCFAQWLPENKGRIVLLGWCWTATIINRPNVPGRGNWLNFEIQDTELLPMSRLRDELEAWKARAAWL